jgi:predicted Zn-dependent peptidase
MEYKKIENNEYNIHIINSNRFKSMCIELVFTKEFNEKDIAYSNLLTGNMVYSTKKYNTKNKIAIVGEELYGARVASSYNISGKCQSLSFSLGFLNPKYTEEKYLKESIDFLYEVIFNPNIKNGEFDKDFFDIIKKDNIVKVNSIKDNPNSFAGVEYSKIMYKGTPSSRGSVPTLEELDKVTPKNLYEFYKKLFEGSYRINVIIAGEISDESAILSLIENKLKNIKGSKEKLEFKIEHKYNDKLVEKIDSLPYNQSKLYMGYRLNNLSAHEMNHVLRVYNTILGTMNDSLLFNIVREENSLCYSIGSYYSKYNPSLTIYAGINKTNYDKTVELIKKCVELMKDKKTIEKLMPFAKKTINTYLNNYYDDGRSQINYYLCSEFEYTEDIETIREKIESVTVDEIIAINDKITLSVIYLLKGDNN